MEPGRSTSDNGIKHERVSKNGQGKKRPEGKGNQRQEKVTRQKRRKGGNEMRSRRTLRSKMAHVQHTYPETTLTYCSKQSPHSKPCSAKKEQHSLLLLLRAPHSRSASIGTLLAIGATHLRQIQRMARHRQRQEGQRRREGVGPRRETRTR